MQFCLSSDSTSACIVAGNSFSTLHFSQNCISLSLQNTVGNGESDNQVNYTKNALSSSKELLSGEEDPKISSPGPGG